MRKTIISGLSSLGMFLVILSGSSFSNTADNNINLPIEVDYVEAQLDTEIHLASVDATAQPQEVIVTPEPELIVVRRYQARASWYRHGRTTANGERFDPNELTVAHRRLPFNTLVRFTNPINGSAIIARVNDRGPYIDGREFDLSMRSAQLLGFQDRGVVRLDIEILR